MPVTFLRNEGQVDGPAQYYVRGRDKSIYFAPGGVTFSFTAPGGRGPAPSSRPNLPWTANNPAANLAGTMQAAVPGPGAARWNVRLEFPGSRPNTPPEGLERSEGVVSYLRGKPSSWKRGLPTFHELRYHELWPGIDLHYRGAARRLKYEFVVRPGADPERIRLAYRGAESVTLTSSGGLEVRTPCGGFTDEKPLAFQEVEGGQVSVAADFELVGGSVRFRLGDYDRSRELVIDPAVFIYVGYLGGEGDDEAYGVTVDSQGNAFVVGATDSAEDTFPVGVGPDLTFGGGAALGIDAFIAKVSPDGAGLVYAGYIGGEGDDWAFSVALGPDGTPYVAGWTNSSEATFPVVTGPGLHYEGGRDAWIAHLTADGTGLQYCGYLGGSQQDIAFGAAVDSAGAANITGLTYSNNLPVMNALDPTFNSPAGGSDAFIARISPTGTLTNCGYVGGDEDDEAYGIALDGLGNAYVSGLTLSSQATFPVAVGPDLTFNGIPGASADAFVLKQQADWSAISYCGYIGGSGPDFGFGIAVDAQQRAVVGGATTSHHSTFPVLLGPDLTFNGSTDAWIGRVRADGAGLEYCGYVGGTSGEQALGVAVDSNGNAYLTGHTTSNERSFPARVGPDIKLNSRQGAWLARIAANGSGVDYAGYIEGKAGAIASGVAVDSLGSAFVVGTTAARQDSFPVRGGPDVTLNTDELGVDAFIARVGAHVPGPGSGRLNATPARVSFGSQRAGRTRERRIVLRNTGPGALTVNVPTFPPGSAFTVAPTGDLNLPRRGRASVTITFHAPINAGTSYGGLVLTSSDPTAPVLQIPLAGRSR